MSRTESTINPLASEEPELVTERSGDVNMVNLDVDGVFQRVCMANESSADEENDFTKFAKALEMAGEECVCFNLRTLPPRRITPENAADFGEYNQEEFLRHLSKALEDVGIKLVILVRSSKNPIDLNDQQEFSEMLERAGLKSEIVRKEYGYKDRLTGEKFTRQQAALAANEGKPPLMIDQVAKGEKNNLSDLYPQGSSIEIGADTKFGDKRKEMDVTNFKKNYDLESFSSQILAILEGVYNEKSSKIQGVTLQSPASEIQSAELQQVVKEKNKTCSIS